MIELHICLEPFAGKERDFEALYRDAYVPGISGQAGFRRTTLLKRRDALREYQIHITFESEPLRLKWVASREHAATWPKVEALCARISWAGFDTVAGTAGA
ncbi:MAG: antibiotic biosynthesis monooxygenase [Kiritimatiellae bacterium]|nr:antibiotic biosynthesis monooxygenase [Kiritimatiellia bacterium]